jgi:hypothetical protein
MLDENLIATLEQSLRQTRNAQNRLVVRLREVEAESERLRQEIEALENSALQTEQAIYSLLATIRSGNQNWNLGKAIKVDDNYDVPYDLKQNSRQQANPYNNTQKNNGSYGPPQNSQGGYGGPQNSYRNNTVSYINRNPPPVSQNLEPVSRRFSDRTITQACTLLLRECGSPLHVNEIYNLLVSGGMEFKGNNPTISIAVSLNRNRRFRKVAPGTFDLIMRDASQAVS